MNKTYWLLAALVFVLGVAPDAPGQLLRHSAAKKSTVAASERKAVLKTDAELLAAVWTADTAKREELADDSLLYTSYSGEPLNKRQWIESAKAIDPQTASYETKDVRVVISGSVAIVTGSLGVQFRELHEDGSVREGRGWQRYTHVYQKKRGRWRLIAGQLTPMAKYLWKF